MSAKKRRPGLFMVTANRLIDGEVVFLDADDRWQETFADGGVIDETAADARLAVAEAAVAACQVVGPYLIDVVRDAEGRLQPARYRERMRALGPSVRTDLGKQAATSSTGNASDVSL